MAGGSLQQMLGQRPGMMGGNFGVPSMAQQAPQMASQPMAPPMVSDPVSMGHPMPSAFGGAGTYGGLRGDFTGMGMGGFGGQNQFGGHNQFAAYGGFPAAGMTSSGQAMRPAMFEWPYAGGGMSGLANDLTSLQTPGVGNGGGSVPVNTGVSPPTPWAPGQATGRPAAAAPATTAPTTSDVYTTPTSRPYGQNKGQLYTGMGKTSQLIPYGSSAWLAQTLEDQARGD